MSRRLCNIYPCISGEGESGLEIKIRILPAFGWYLNPLSVSEIIEQKPRSELWNTPECRQQESE